MRVEDIIVHTMVSRPANIALIYKGRRWSYAELQALIATTKGRLINAGLSENDRAVLWIENSPEYIATYLAVLQIGAVVVALHQQTPASEVARLIRHVQATGLIVSSAIRHWSVGDFDSTGVRFILSEDRIMACPALREAALGVPEGLAQIIYTSGSTGQPKGVMLTHRNLISNTQSILSYLHLTPDDSVMAILPFTYAYGNSVLLTHLFVGGTLVIENNVIYPQVILESMRRERVTGLSGVSTTYAIMLNQSNLESASFPALRYMTHAGGPMSSDLLPRIQSAFSGVRMFLMYGQTEATARLTYLPPELLEAKRGSAGHAIPGVRLKIVKEDGATAGPGEVGEVWACGENIMLGYWQDPHETGRVLHDGWLRTGDLGRLDEDGFLVIEGRNSEMIKSGSYRISPTEIEEVLLQHADVDEAGVVGIDDPLLGQKVCAMVTLKAAGTANSQELLAYCAQRLVPYKRPKSITVVAALPKSPSGKLLRQRLREMGRLDVPSSEQLTS